MRMSNFVLLSVLLVGLVVSGCAGPEEEAPVNKDSQTTISTPAPTGDVMDELNFYAPSPTFFLILS